MTFDEWLNNLNQELIASGKPCFHPEDETVNAADYCWHHGLTPEQTADAMGYDGEINSEVSWHLRILEIKAIARAEAYYRECEEQRRIARALKKLN